ncbi:MAG TPA: helix-turn-helix domain-containing protein [Rhizomicrobium sp.]|jgi:AraC-like DNA-binding protein
MNRFAEIANGRESWSANQNLPRHGHREAYAAIVLSGGYEECGSRGRFRVGAGDVLLHAAFDAHLNRFWPNGAQVLNLVLAERTSDFSIAQIFDPDTIARAAERDPAEARARFREQLRAKQCAPVDWPDTLASDLLADPNCRLRSWAENHGLAAETISRGFRKVFGVTPALFRAEARARKAFARVIDSDAPLALIAAAAGFADQAHMSRATRALTGSPPCVWRGSIRFKTAVASAR